MYHLSPQELSEQGIEMTDIQISPSWRLVVLPNGAKSPMRGHGVMELAADHEGKVIYGFEVFVVCYGLASVIKSCEEYVEKYHDIQ